MYSNIGKVYLFRFFKEIHFFGAVGVPFFLDWLQVSYTQIFLLQRGFPAGSFCWRFLLETHPRLSQEAVNHRALFVFSHGFRWQY